MNATIPELALVVLIGASSSGKTTFAAAHFKPTEIVSSDFCRALVSDDATDQTATPEAFELVRAIAAKRLSRGKLTVIDATNVTPDDRAEWVRLAREYHVVPVAIVFDIPEPVIRERHKARDDRAFHRAVLFRQIDTMRRSLRHLRDEGFRRVIEFRRVADVDSAVVKREPMWSNRKHDRGPFDIIGDVHGCFDELVLLLRKLGYTVDERSEAPTAVPPPSRKAVFVGDYVDRGPNSPAVLRLVMDMQKKGDAICLPGNHDIKLHRFLSGRNVKRTHGLAETIAQLEAQPPEFRAEIAEFIDGLVSHLIFDDGQLVVAHAGIKAELQGRASGAVREFCLYGETTGEIDEFGLPVRLDWAAHYRGHATVVYGHTPVPRAEWVNRTICIDTGCVFGGKLTALRWPERELVEVPATQQHYPPTKPLESATDRPYPDLLDIADVLGHRAITCRIFGAVTVREPNGIAALEVMSRFAVDPHWLIYLPPTMSPVETAPANTPWLEHPAEALDYFARHHVTEVVAQEKHMGSRAVVVLCRDDATARAKFGAETGRRGIVYTRTGRAFFTHPTDGHTLESAFLARLDTAMQAAKLWDELATDWVCFDGEILPWTAKAKDLLQRQYAAVGAAGTHALQTASTYLQKAAQRDGEEAATVAEWVHETDTRLDSLHRYVTAYRHYCWPVNQLDDLKFAPFHLLASHGAVHTTRDHEWHIEMLNRLAAADPGLFRATPIRTFDPADETARAAAVAWWQEITDAGGEGAVFKPRHWIVRDRHHQLVQPALKVRGPDYLRIIYGPEYRHPEYLERLRFRRLGTKRALAIREFALGLEALHRFVEGEPLYRIHECVFAVLALESEPVNPRL